MILAYILIDNRRANKTSTHKSLSMGAPSGGAGFLGCGGSGAAITLKPHKKNITHTDISLYFCPFFIWCKNKDFFLLTKYMTKIILKKIRLQGLNNFES